ncbi:metal-sensitive transcriptional regulator [Aneurinibacillus sp. REN35]|uniref:metal-sensitive transcriptional regulator n=1 Tax=Aneurinibacillus sp. REN35 TaxID=3237286 RepID=UPI003527F196
MNKAIQHRLRRMEGQVRGVLKMLENEKDCKEVITQLTAIRSATDRAIALIVAQNMEECIRKELEQGNRPDDVIKESVDLLVKSR